MVESFVAFRQLRWYKRKWPRSAGGIGWFKVRSCIECKKGDIVGKINSSLEVSSSKVL